MSNASGLPDLVFVETDAAKIEASMVATVEAEMSRAAGKTVTLALGDPRRAVVSAAVLLLIQERLHINETGRQNLRQYAAGAPLLALGALVLGDAAAKLPASHALSTARFTLSAARATVTAIAAGERLAAGSVLFETTAAIEIPIGDLTGDATIRAVESGVAGNGFVAGQINAMVNPIPFVASVENISTSEGGAPEESDEDYSERMGAAPGSFSTAGPESAYAFWAKSASAAISDVAVLTDEESPGSVMVVPLLYDGKIPGSEILALVEAACSARDRRPLTDSVEASAPEAVAYNVNLTYWIDAEDAKKATTIQDAVSAAVVEYAAWQRAKLGRDINPDKLRALVVAAGAKRLTVAAPSFTALTAGQVAQEGTVAVTYGGLEEA